MQSTDQLRIDTPEQIALELPLAGIGSRFLALALDTIFQSVLYVVASFAIGFLFAYIVPSTVERYLSWIPPNVGIALLILFIFSVYWGYFALFENFWKGQTPGKRIAKIRVIHESGRPVNAYEAIGRNLLRVVDGMFVYAVGIICMMCNNQNRRIGDYVAGTVVVHDRKAEEIHLDYGGPIAGASSSPQLANITADDLTLIETFLQRRGELDWAVRDNTAYRIAERITAKTGITRAPDESLDHFLETVARQIRDTARFR